MHKPAYAAVFGAGVWMIDLCIQLYSSANPDKIKPHPYAVAALGILGLFLLVYAAYSWISQRGSMHSAAPPTVAIPPITINNSPVFTNAPTITQEASPVNTQTTTISASPPTNTPPHLRFRLAVERLRYALPPGKWVKRDAYHTHSYDNPLLENFLLAYFENPILRKNESGENLNPLVAHVQFLGSHMLGTRIERAYWLDETHNNVSLDVGQEKAVVLGCFNPPCFVTFENQNTWSSNRIFFLDEGPSYYQRGPQINLSAIGPIRAVISLVSPETSRTIEAKEVEIRFLAGGTIQAQEVNI